MKLKDLLSNKTLVGILFVFFPFILMGETCWKYNFTPIGLKIKQNKISEIVIQNINNTTLYTGLYWGHLDGLIELNYKNNIEALRFFLNKKNILYTQYHKNFESIISCGKNKERSIFLFKNNLLVGATFFADAPWGIFMWGKKYNISLRNKLVSELSENSFIKKNTCPNLDEEIFYFNIFSEFELEFKNNRLAKFAVNDNLFCDYRLPFGISIQAYNQKLDLTDSLTYNECLRFFKNAEWKFEPIENYFKKIVIQNQEFDISSIAVENISDEDSFYFNFVNSKLYSFSYTAAPHNRLRKTHLLITIEESTLPFPMTKSAVLKTIGKPCLQTDIR